jgi:DNA-3-methyladenine glycosylase II
MTVKRAAPKSRARVRPPPAPPAPILDEAALAAGLAALRRTDSATIGMMLAAAGAVPLRRREPGFEGLCWIIAGQQVSTAAARAIFARLQAGVSPLAPQTVLAASDGDLRGCGLSAPKARAVRALAQACVDGLDLAGLAALEAEAAHKALCAVKGIGPWTADIFLLFCLGHADAWPAGDLALQEALRMALGLKTRPDAKRATRLAERWRPHRGVAARLLWAYYGVMKGRTGVVLADREKP